MRIVFLVVVFCAVVRCGLIPGSMTLTLGGNVLLPSMSTVNVIERRELLINCSSANANINSYIWTKQKDSSFEVYDNVLRIPSIQLVHIGGYICSGSSFNKTLEQSYVYLNVLYPPDQPLIQGPDIVLKGEEVNLTCSVNSNPVSSFIWATDSYLEDKDILARSATLSISTDRGVYCYVENTLIPTHGETVTTRRVQYKFPVRQEPVHIWEPNSDYQFNVSDTLDVNCNVIGNPEPTVWWTKAGDSLFQYSGKRLVVANVQTSFTGYYTCHAQNTLAPSGRPEQVTSSNATTYITIIDRAIPENCQQFCQTSANGGPCGNTSPTPENACDNSTKHGLIAATVVGWIVALFLGVVIIFFCIKMREQNIATSRKENRGFTDPNPSAPRVAVRPQVNSRYDNSNRNTYIEPNPVLTSLPVVTDLRTSGNPEHHYLELDAVEDVNRAANREGQDQGRSSDSDQLSSNMGYLVPHNLRYFFDKPIRLEPQDVGREVAESTIQ